MANELQLRFNVSGDTLYAQLVRNTDGKIWNGTTFESITAADWSLYTITVTEVTGTGYYFGNMPSVAQGLYNVHFFLQAGGSPADTDHEVGGGAINWSGSVDLGLFQVALSSSGLDAVVVETGLNARQSLSIIAAASAGVLSGAGTTSILISGAGVVTQRISATVTTNPAGNRTEVTLSPPI